MFITDIKSDLELRCHRTRRTRVFSGRAGGNLRDILLENRGADTKAAAGGGVQRLRMRTKWSETKKTKSARPFHRESMESKMTENETPLLPYSIYFYGRTTYIVIIAEPQHEYGTSIRMR